MIYLASDHRGMVRKEEIKKLLDELGEKFVDVGDLSFNPEDDAIDFVTEACGKITPEDKGIFFCGSGVMVDIVANRFSNIRSCLAANPDQVKAGRREDDVNVLCLGGDNFGAEDSAKLVKVFLATEFDGGENYKRRLEKLKEIP